MSEEARTAGLLRLRLGCGAGAGLFATSAPAAPTAAPFRNRRRPTGLLAARHWEPPTAESRGELLDLEPVLALRRLQNALGVKRSQAVAEVYSPSESLRPAVRPTYAGYISRRRSDIQFLGYHLAGVVETAHGLRAALRATNDE